MKAKFFRILIQNLVLLVLLKIWNSKMKMIVMMIVWKGPMMKVMRNIMLFRIWMQFKTAKLKVNLYLMREKRKPDVMMIIDIKTLNAYNQTHNHTHIINTIHVINPIMLSKELIKVMQHLNFLSLHQHL
jgi:hypothetical protein